MTMHSDCSLFDLTQQVVAEAERRVLKFKSKHVASRNGLFPIPFIQLGIGELLRPMCKWAIFAFGSLAVAMIFLPTAVVSPETKIYVLMFCTFVPLFLVVFAVPSTFAFDTITSPQIGGLADYISTLGFNNKTKLESLSDCLEQVKERTYARTRAFQGTVAAIWALFLYGLNQYTSIALKFVPAEQSAKIIGENLSTLIVYGFVSLLSLLVIFGYKKANDAVFMRISFSIEELKYRMVQAASAQPIIPSNAAR